MVAVDLAVDFHLEPRNILNIPLTPIRSHAIPYLPVRTGQDTVAGRRLVEGPIRATATDLHLRLFWATRVPRAGRPKCKW